MPSLNAVALATTCLMIFAALPGAPAVARPQQKATTAGRTENEPRTLAEALALVRWNAASRGPLLVLGAQNVRAARPFAPASRPGAAPGLAAVAAHFGRKIVVAGGVSVLAPTTMVVLNTRPGVPAALAGMGKTDKLRLLLASLRPEQWDRIGGASGLGRADLDRTQQPLFDLLLGPPPALVRTWMGGQKSHRIAAGQWERARLRLNRDTTVALAAEDGPPSSAFGSLSGAPEARPSGTDIFLPVDDEDEAAPSPPRPAGEAALAARVPSRAKPGQLAFDAPAFDARISLAEAETVDDLVQRAAKATNLELFADRRVGRLPVWTRGSSARAGDVLQALSRAVTGAWRQVTPAAPDTGRPVYVLTDDVVGIGTRYAPLWEWERDAGVLAQSVSADADARIASAVPDASERIGWVPGDPLAVPDSVLRQVGAQYGLPERNIHGVEVPLSTLPPALQNAANAFARQRAAMPGSAPLRTDTVRVNVGLRVSLLVPGTGEGEIEVLHDDINPDEALNGALLPRPANAAAPPTGDTSPTRPPAVVLRVPAGKTAALLLSPTTPDEARAAVVLARRLGFTQLWVGMGDVAAPNGRQTLETAVAAGRDLRPPLPVFAAVSLLKRRASTAAAANQVSRPDAAQDVDGNETGDEDDRDRNRLGETSTALARRRDQSALARTNGYARGAIDHLLDPANGDFLRFDTPAFAQARKNNVLAIAAIPGLAGLALRHTQAPGYPDEDDHESRGWYFGLGESGDFGHSAAWRVAFLRREGYDPVDLSFGGPLQIRHEVALPFFPDKGVPTRNISPPPAGTILPRPEPTPAERWQTFRREANARLLSALFKQLRAERPNLPLLVAEGSGSALIGVRYWDSWDKADALPRAEQIRAPDGTESERNPRALSRRVLSNLVVPANVSADDFAHWAGSVNNRLGEQGALAPDGAVLDLSRLENKRASVLLAGAFAATPSQKSHSGS